jgi:hypothetical protein
MDRPTPQLLTTADSTRESERERRTKGILSQQLLQRQNRTFAGSGGVSQNNSAAGFVPGYFNTRSGVAVRSCFSDGAPAPIHLLDGLPDSWILTRGNQGKVLEARPEVIAGFIRDGIFYTREEAALATKN